MTQMSCKNVPSQGKEQGVWPHSTTGTLLWTVVFPDLTFHLTDGSSSPSQCQT